MRNDRNTLTALAVLLIILVPCSAAASLLCTLVFRLSDNVAIGQLEWNTDYSSAPGYFPGAGSNVDCASLVGDLSAFDDSDATKSLTADISSLSGFTGPVDIAECSYMASAQPGSGDFAITVIQAYAPMSLEPIVPLPTVEIASLLCEPATDACGDSTIDPGEQCDDGNTVDGDCCSVTCQLEADGSACDDGGFCTVDDACAAGVCVGLSRQCPSHAPCEAGWCDEDSDTCALKSAATVCRAGAGPCDVAEYCDGSSGDCPADAFAAPGTNTWSPAASMSAARFAHTATRLPDGRVLVAGGYNEGNPSGTATAEIYDPALGTWSLTGSMGTVRYTHTATLLPDGRVLVMGGGYDSNSGRWASAEIYDPAVGSWSSTASMATIRELPTATVLPDGRVLVSGGGYENGGYLASAEIYDPVAGTWSPTGSMGTPRYGHTATLLPDGRVLVSGGTYAYPPNLYTASAEIYDPALGTWSPTGSMVSARGYHTANLLPDGRVLVSGGGDVNDGALFNSEIYDPVPGTWSPTGSMGTSRCLHTATSLPDGRVLVSGGHNDIPEGSVALTSAEIYDPALASWSPAGSMGTARYVFTATLLRDGRVLAVGAFYDSPVASASAETFAPASICRSASGTCDIGERCTGLSVDCPADNGEAPIDPALCLVAVKNRFKIADPTGTSHDKLSWQWAKGDAFTQADLGTPDKALGTSYTLCVYDKTASIPSLKASIDIAPSATLWTSKDPKGLQYKDKPGMSEGVTRAQLKTGIDGRTKVKVSAGGTNLLVPSPAGSVFFNQNPNVVVQLVNSAGKCWTSQFTPSDTTKNEADQFRAQTK